MDAFFVMPRSVSSLCRYEPRIVVIFDINTPSNFFFEIVAEE